jgi:hypothetical protein
MEKLKLFFTDLARTKEGQEAIAFYDRIFQFVLPTGEAFIMEKKAGQFEFRAGKIPNPDLLKEVTIVETDSQTLQDLMDVKLSPSAAVESGRFWTSGDMAVKPFNFWLLRLFKLGQKIKIDY